MEREKARPASRPPMSKVRGTNRIMSDRKSNEESARSNIRSVSREIDLRMRKTR
jgi:hypothetical protein